MTTEQKSVPKEEYRQRTERLAAAITEKGLDAVLVVGKGGATLDSYADLLYFTNHYSTFPYIPDCVGTWSGHSFSACVLTASGKSTLICDVPPREDLVVADSIEVVPKVGEGIAQVLRSLGLADGKLGLIGSYCLPLTIWRELTRDISAEWTDVDAISTEMRLTKSPAEIAIIREAMSVGNAVVEAMLAACVPGTTEAGAVAAAHKKAIELGAAMFDVPAASGPDAPHFSHGRMPSCTKRVLEEGDVFHADLYGSYQGYSFDFGRSTIVGGASGGEQADALDVSIELVERLIAKIATGVTYHELYQAGLGLAKELGGTPVFPAFGHSLGMWVDPVWIAAGEERTVQPNQFIAVEALLSVGGDHITLSMYEENLLFTEDGVEILSTVDSRPWLRH